MTPEQIKAYNRAKTQRRRAADQLGLTHVRLWVEPDDVSLVGMVKDRTEALIDDALARKHGDTTRVSLDDLRAMRDRGEIKAHDNAKPGKDLPDEFWDDAEEQGSK